MQILFVYSRPASFVEIDLRLLRERWDVREWAQPGRYANPPRSRTPSGRPTSSSAGSRRGTLPAVHVRARAREAVAARRRLRHGEHAGDRLRLPARRRRSGSPRRSSAARRSSSRTRSTRATRSSATSASRRRTSPSSTTASPIRSASSPRRARADRADGRQRRLADLRAEGPTAVRCRPRGSRPELRFALVGKWLDGAVDLLRQLGGDNVEYTGQVSDEELAAWYARSSVYVQASRHEAFGMSLAEAMLGGCIPVVSQAGALPEVVGDVGAQLDGPIRRRSRTPRGSRVRSTARSACEPASACCAASRSRRAPKGWRRRSRRPSAAGEPVEVGQPDLDQRPHRLLEPRLERDRERLLVALARLRRIDALLQAVVAGDEQLLDPLARIVPLHNRSVTRQDRLNSPASSYPWRR